MLVEVGHDAPHGPAVCYARLNEDFGPDVNEDLNLQQVALHIISNPLVTHLPGLEPLLAMVNGGILARAGITNPHWVASSDPLMESLLSRFMDVPRGRPEGLQDHYWTKQGNTSYPPGAHPDPMEQVDMMLTGGGRDSWAQNLWSPGTSVEILGQSGTATAASSNQLLGGTETPGGNHNSNDLNYCTLIVPVTGGYAYGLITSVATSGSFLTGTASPTAPGYGVDRWSNPGAPGGAALGPPSNSATYTVMPGGPPAYFMGISTSTATVQLTDTVLPGEILSSTDTGLIRKLATASAHVGGTNQVIVSTVYTATGVGGGLPVTIAKMGISQSLLSTVKNMLQTLFTPPGTTAILNVGGDQVTVTDTITGS